MEVIPIPIELKILVIISISFIGGYLIGVLSVKLRKRNKISGRLHITETDSSEVWTFEFIDPIDEIKEKDIIEVQIQKHN